MHHYARASLLIVAVLFAASCSDANEDARLTATQPSLLGTSLVGVTATSSTVFPQPVGNPSCPSVAPFNVSFGVIVRGSVSSDVVITSLRTVFVDTSGRRGQEVTLPMIPVTLPAPGPTLQFGSARTFPVTLGIGCGTGPRGTVFIVVETSDNTGRHGSDRVSVAVR
jgi:hypothetical protein